MTDRAGIGLRDGYPIRDCRPACPSPGSRRRGPGPTFLNQATDDNDAGFLHATHPANPDRGHRDGDDARRHGALAGGGTCHSGRDPAYRRGLGLCAGAGAPSEGDGGCVGADGERCVVHCRQAGGARSRPLPERDQRRQRGDDGAACARPLRDRPHPVLRHRGRRGSGTEHRRCGDRGPLGAVPRNAVRPRDRKRLGHDALLRVSLPEFRHDVPALGHRAPPPAPTNPRPGSGSPWTRRCCPARAARRTM